MSRSRKRFVGAGLFCFAALVALGGVASSDSPTLTMYENANYQGGHVSLGVGEWCLFNAPASESCNKTYAGFNDVASSVACLPAELDARFYDDGYKAPRARMFDLHGGECVPDVSTWFPGMNDRTSRVVVCTASDTSCTRPIFYLGEYRGSNGFIVDAGEIQDLGTSGSWIPGPTTFGPSCPCGSGPLPPYPCQACNINDSFRSVSVPAGWKVTFCVDHFQGAPCASLTGPSFTRLANVQGQNFERKVSYVKAEHVAIVVAPNGATTPTLWVDVNYGGAALAAPGAMSTGALPVYPLPALGGNRNQFSSTYVPQGFKVTIFEGDSFTSTSVVVEGPSAIPDLSKATFGNWNDRIRSLIIQKE